MVSTYKTKKKKKSTQQDTKNDREGEEESEKIQNEITMVESRYRDVIDMITIL